MVPVLSIESTTSDTISLQWSSAGREHIDYRIAIDRDPLFGCRNEYSQVIHLTNDTTNVLVVGLEEASRYSVNITASNDVGSTEEGNTVIAMTAEAGIYNTSKAIILLFSYY